MNEKIRLRAEDIEDLAVIAALLQDARLTLDETVFEPDDNRFMAAFVRFRRELAHDPLTCEGLSETPAALVFDCIDEVKHRGLDSGQRDRTLTLLTIATEPGDKWMFHINLVFEGDSVIQLRSDCIDCRLEDFGDARRSVRTPCDHFASLLSAEALAEQERRKAQGGESHDQPAADGS